MGVREVRESCEGGGNPNTIFVKSGHLSGHFDMPQRCPKSTLYLFTSSLLPSSHPPSCPSLG